MARYRCTRNVILDGLNWFASIHYLTGRIVIFGHFSKVSTLSTASYMIMGMDSSSLSMHNITYISHLFCHFGSFQLYVPWESYQNGAESFAAPG